MSLLVALLFATQGGVVTGWVFDATDSTPVRGVNVAVVGSDLGAGTDSRGRFVILNAPARRVRLSVTHVGFEPASVLLARGDSARRVRLYLSPQTIALAPVEVHRPRAGAGGPSAVELGRAEVRSLPGAEKDLFRAVQSLPGVSSTGDYFGWLYVRGGLPEENLFLLDGMEIPNPYHFSGLASVFSTELVERVRFSTGGFGAERGDRISSVLEVDSRGARRTSAAVGADVTELGASVELPVRAGAGVVAAVRHSYLDKVLSRLDLGESYVLPTFTDVQARSSVRLGERAELAVSLLGSSERASAGDSGHWRAPAIALESRLFSGAVAAEWRPSGRVELRSAVSALESRTRFEVDDRLAKRFREQHPRKLSVSVDGRLEVAAPLLVEAGLSAARAGYEHHSTLPEELLDSQRWGDSLSADTTTIQAGAYATLRGRVGPAVQFAAGARFDFRQLDRAALGSPRLSVSWEPRPGTRVQAAAGVYRQFVAPQFRNPDGEQPAPLRSRHFVAGVEQELDRGFSLKVEGYDKRLANLVVASAGRFTSDGAGRARGVEASARKRVSDRAFVWASYGYARAERSWLHGIELSPADGEQPHIFNLAGSAVLPGAVTVGLKLRVASGAPYTPEKFVREQHCLPGPHNAARYPLYRRLDLRVERGFAAGPGRLDAYLSVLNVLGAKNVQQYYYDNAGERHAIYMLPRLPVLGLEYRF